MPAARTTLLLALTTCAACLGCGQALAQEPGNVEPLVTDRPDTTESAQTVARGRFQLEAGYSFLDRDRSSTHQFGELLGRVGLSDAVELRIGLNSFVWRSGDDGDRSGTTNTSLGAKVKLVAGDGAGRPDVAMILSTRLPTGSLAAASKSLEPRALLAAGWSLSERVSLGVNAGYANIEGGEGRRLGEFTASASIGLSLGDRLGTFVEYFGFYPAQADQATIHAADAGVTWLLSPDLQLDARTGYEFSGSGRENTFFIGAGVSSRW